jgi:hypothetical protein
VSKTVRRADGKGTIQHTREEDQAIIRVPGFIRPVFPDK